MHMKHCFCMQAIDLMEGLIPNRQVHGLLPIKHLNKLIVFAIMWSAGALLELDDRVKMEEYLRSCNCLDLPEITVGSQETIFEYVVDINGQLLIIYLLYIMTMVASFQIRI